MAKITLPSMLAYQGSIRPGAGFYSAILEDGSKVPVEVKRTKGRGTMANYKEAKLADNAEMIGRPNPQEYDVAILPPGTEYFEMGFALSVSPCAMKPYNCNDVVVSNALKDLASAYVKKGGMRFLAKRYLANILEGGWLWRNAQQFETGTISVSYKVEGEKKVYSSKLTAKGPQGEAPEDLVNVLEEALSGGIRVAVLQVSAKLDAFAGLEVYPSQEFKLDGDKDVSRIFCSVEVAPGINQASMHPQKIGNALRRIDAWYTPLPGFQQETLAVEPLGVDASNQVAHRAVHKEDFYTLIEGKYDSLLASIDAAPAADVIPGDVHYVIGVLVRGGVFSGEKKAAPAPKAPKAAKVGKGAADVDAA
ncbi:type I-F CRISPR-associated protein Csy3 [Pseudomonas putida]|nr:type I-F CRISPR-associated protein Csy3 [Pseudomonas putida]